MERRGSAQRLLGNFTEALETLGADPKLVKALTRAREEVLPKAEKLLRDVDQVLDRAAELKYGLGEMRAEISREEEG
ncbi:MAG: hypothetical protein ACRD1X_18015 [Vicinamibacteria bacterium]